jgi:hypothetical protein
VNKKSDSVYVNYGGMVAFERPITRRNVQRVYVAVCLLTASCVSGNALLRAEEVGHAMTVAVKKERRACHVNPTFSGPLSTLVVNCVLPKEKLISGRRISGYV